MIQTTRVLDGYQIASDADSFRSRMRPSLLGVDSHGYSRLRGSYVDSSVLKTAGIGGAVRIPHPTSTT